MTAAATAYLERRADARAKAEAALELLRRAEAPANLIPFRIPVESPR